MLFFQGARGECGVWLEENKSNVLWSYLGNLSSFPQLSAPSACFVAIVFASKYETTSSIFLRIKQEPHKLWMASDSYVFGDGLLYVLKDYTCIHNTLPWLRQDSWIPKGKNIVIVTLILTMRASKHYVTSFKFLGSVVASKKTTNCVWMFLKKLPCTESERVNRED